MTAPDISRERWLELRRTTLGASEAAAAVGESPRTSPLELWAVKTGLVPEEKFQDEQVAERLFWGNKLEPTIVGVAAERSGLTLIRDRHEAERALTADGACRVIGWVDGRQPWLESRERPWQTATLDGVARDEKGRLVLLEVKNVGWHSSHLWEPGDEDAGSGELPAPTEYVVQSAHQLAVVACAPRAVLAALLGGSRMILVPLDRAEQASTISGLIEAERAFWGYLERRLEPPYDGSPSAQRALRLLHPDDNGLAVRLSDDLLVAHEELQSLRAQLKVIRAAGRKLEADAARARGALSAAIGDNTYGLFDNGVGFYSLTTRVRRAHTVPESKTRKLDWHEPKTRGGAQKRIARKLQNHALDAGVRKQIGAGG